MVMGSWGVNIEMRVVGKGRVDIECRLCSW